MVCGPACGYDRSARLVRSAASLFPHPVPLLRLPLRVGLAVLIAVAAGLLAPGVYR